MGAFHTLHEHLSLWVFLDAEQLTATANSNILDMGATKGESIEEMLILLCVGASTGTGQTLDVKMQEDSASDMSTAADITGAVFVQVTATTDEKLYFGRLRPGLRYLRAVLTIAGTSPVFPTCMLGIGRNAGHKPPTNPSTVDTAVEFDVAA